MTTLIHSTRLDATEGSADHRVAATSPRSGAGSSTMEAAVVTAPGEIAFKKVAVPTPGPGEVRVRLEGCGVCGSNLSPWQGKQSLQYPLQPGELGHEGWGHVDEVGPEVGDLKVGERVAMLSYRAFAEYDVAPATSMVVLPPELNGQPFPGEALGCAMNVFRRSDIFPGQVVAIVGIGFLGAVLTALCAKAGASVIAISRREFSLKTARQMGARETLLLNEPQEIVERIKTLTSGNLCDCVIEATGHQLPLDLAGEVTGERGRLVIAGYHQGGTREVNMQLWNWRGIDVVNAHERDPKVKVSGMGAVMEAIAGGVLDPTPLYTHSFPFHDLARALNMLTERPDNFLKGLVHFANA